MMKRLNPFDEKTKEEKIEYLNSLSYSVILKQKNDRFYLIIPELSLIGVSDNLEEAYQELSNQKEKLLARLIDCEADDEIILPRNIHKTSDTFHQIKVFIYKLVIICVIGGFTIVTSAALLANKIAQISAVDILKRQARSFIVSGERYLNAAMGGSKQEKLEKVKLHVDELRPFVREIQTLFTSPVNDGEEKTK
jgi:hypothetical protein